MLRALLTIKEIENNRVCLYFEPDMSDVENSTEREKHLAADFNKVLDVFSEYVVDVHKGKSFVGDIKNLAKKMLKENLQKKGG